MSRRTYLLEGISRYTLDQKVTRAAKAKSYLTNLLAFLSEITQLADKGSLRICLLNFRKVLTVFHGIILSNVDR